MPNDYKKEIEEEFEERFYGTSEDLVVGQGWEEQSSWLSQALDKVEAETAKAFGSCTKCYGKGYATTIEYIEGYPDFPGDTGFMEKLPGMRFCPCDRGEQLKGYVDKYKLQVEAETLRRVREKVENELDIQRKVEAKSREVVVVGRRKVNEMLKDVHIRIGKVEALHDILSLLTPPKEQETL